MSEACIYAFENVRSVYEQVSVNRGKSRQIVDSVTGKGFFLLRFDNLLYSIRASFSIKKTGDGIRSCDRIMAMANW